MRMNWKLMLVALSLYSAGCMKDDSHTTNNVSEQDRTFMMKAAQGDMAEITAGTIAMERGSDPSVRAFGSMMVTDHNMAKNDLTTIANQQGVALPTEPDSMHKAMAAMLATMSGRQFDSMYLRSQVTDHVNMGHLFKTEQSNGNRQNIKDHANKYLPKIQMHLYMADSMVAAMSF